MAIDQNTVELAEKIVAEIAANPQMADQYKGYLVQTLNDVYKIGAAEKAGDKTLAIAETKSLLTSKTFWGIALAGAAMAAPHFGMHFTQDQVGQSATDIVGIVGLALGLYGRIKAAKQIG